MEQAVFDIHNVQLSHFSLDVAASQASLEVVNATLPGSDSTNPLLCFLNALCHDPHGWGPVDKHFAFTPCFISGVLTNIPNAILILFGSYQLYSLSSKRPRANPVDWHLITKLSLICSEFILYIALIAVIASGISAPLSDIVFWSPFISAVVLVLAASLHYIEHFRSLIPSGSLLFFWLFKSLTGFFGIYQLVLMSQTSKTFSLASPVFVLNVLILANSILVFIFEWIVPKYNTSGHDFDVDSVKSPLDSADVFSRITFSWMGPLMTRGYETFLTADDLPALPYESSTSPNTNRLAHYWQQQLSSKKNPSLFLAITKSFGGQFFVASCFKTTQDILAFTQPQLLRLLIRFVNDYSQKKEDATVAKGFSIAFGMFLVSITQTSALHQYFQRVIEVGMKIKASLTASIYQKALVLSTEDRGKKSQGDIVNLMSVDTQRLQDLCQYGQTLWSGPFQIILCLVSLHNLLGNSMWGGVAIMLIMLPINSVASKYQRQLQTQQMKSKDMRTRLTNELLTNIKSLKLYGWEVPFTERLTKVRNDVELRNLRSIGLYMSLLSFLWNITPYLVSCSTFTIYVLTSDKPLTTDMVFPALNLFNLLNFPLAVFPNVITSCIEASVAISRLTEFFVMEEIQPDAVIRLDRATQIGEEAVTVTNGTFLWQRNQSVKIALSDINFKASKGDLSCIVGKVGSGKSALLQAILGDLHKSEGIVTVKGHVAYVAQTPWIINATVKENILFGSKYDPEFYQRTIDACALLDDLTILPDGDQTMVGEKGISLSGGQKARLSLARAVYARADVYLLDDVLSAVDEHVGAHIIENVLNENGLLASKTRVLCTNSITILSHADNISMVSEGRIVEHGTSSEVLAAKGKIFNLMKEFGKKRSTSSTESASGETSTAASVTVDSDFQSDENVELPTQITEDALDEDASTLDFSKVRKRRGSVQTIRRASIDSFTRVRHDDEEHTRRTQVQKEHMEQGKVKWSVYKQYAKSCNPFAVAAFFLLIIGSSLFSVSSGFWLKHWSEKNTEAGRNEHTGFYLGVYFFICISTTTCTVLYTLVLMIGCSIQAARKLHEQMLISVIRSPMSFFETTPLGRIINRFSNDIYRIDQLLARVFSQFFSNLVQVSFTLFVITYNTPPFILLIAPLGFLYIYYQRRYLRTSRELKRLDSVSKSPIYAHFQEALGGISTIRAFGQQDRFTFINESSMDVNLQAYFPSVSANRWLAVRLEFIGSIIIFCASGLSIAMIGSGHVTAGTIGLAMSYALQITQSLNWIVRMTVEVETNIVSVERVLEYSNLPSEAPAIIENHRPPAAWPQTGEIVFNNYSTRYRPELDLVLKDISLNIKPREKVGVVGRTGAGKSSLTLVLFRIIEAAGGSISIDGIDISTIGLQDLRHKLSIIPQDSQAFEGTLRENIDPNDEYDDTDLWRALELAHLKDHVVNNMEGGLDAKIAELGSNLSLGQRQLLSLARALLIRSQILVLDEATASIDVETDRNIQRTIREEFKDRTIITIAHRLNTIADSDKIIVLSEGRLVEFASPQELLQDKNSQFYSLAKRGGLITEE